MKVSHLYLAGTMALAALLAACTSANNTSLSESRKSAKGDSVAPGENFDAAATPRGAPVRHLRADYVRVEKSRRVMTLYAKGRPIASFHVALGSQPSGAKTREGDGRTPEGRYIIDWHNAHSDYYLSMHISYPNAQDKARARAMGVSPGGDIMVHGVGRDPATLARVRQVRDWTAGCISVSDREMAEIFHMVPDRTPIQILP